MTNLFTFHYVSIKSASNVTDKLKNFLFTFHYVSIKSDGTDHNWHY